MRAEQRILHLLHVAFASLVEDCVKWIVKRVFIALWRVAKERFVLLQTLAICMSFPMILPDTYNRFLRVAKVTALIFAGIGTCLVIVQYANNRKKQAALTSLTA